MPAMPDTPDAAARDPRLPDLIAAALKAGADQAEAVLSDRQALSVGVRNGALEDVERQESRDLSLRVFVGRRQAIVSTSDLSDGAAGRLVERAVAMARLAPEDPYAGLAEPDSLAVAPFAELDQHDPTARDAAALEAAARAAEAAAVAVPGVSRSEGADAGWSVGRWRLVTSHGVDLFRRRSRFSLSASVIAERDGAMERSGDGRTTRHLEDLITPEALGADIGRRAAAKVGARKIASTTAPVIFENRLAGQLLSPLVGAMSGPAVARGVSFLKDRLGQRVLPEGVSLTDDPFAPRALGSTAFDDEGVAVRAMAPVEDGVLTTWLLNTAAGRQLGLGSTGHAARGGAGPSGVSLHNGRLSTGELDLNGLMRAAGRGLLITGMFGPSLNPNTGDWSAGVNGFWFEDGAIAYPVNEVTVAGALPELYLRLVPGRDLELRGGLDAPSLLIDAVAIAGK
jgi:PmbA protein